MGNTSSSSPGGVSDSIRYGGNEAETGQCLCGFAFNSFVCLVNQVMIYAIVLFSIFLSLTPQPCNTICIYRRLLSNSMQLVGTDAIDMYLGNHV